MRPIDRNPFSPLATGRTLLLCLPVLLLSTTGRAADLPDSTTERIRLGAGVGVMHDDNILQYSDGQIRTFEAGTHPDRYSIESIGDVVWEPSVSLAYFKDRGTRRGRMVRLRWSGSFHATNATADYGAGSLTWRESFSKGRAITFGVYELPNYYLRQLRDEDIPLVTGVSRYRRASFDLTIGSVEWRQRVAPRTTLSLDYQYERRAYNDDFKERDSDTHVVGLGGDWSPKAKPFSLAGSAAYRTSRAAGEDGDEVPGAQPDDADISYNGMVFSAGTRVDLAHGSSGRLEGEIGSGVSTRNYTTDRVNDTSHYQRDDLIFNMTIGLRWNPRGPFSVRGFYEHENDKTSFSSPAPPTSDPSSYSANLVGLSVDWGQSLWRR